MTVQNSDGRDQYVATAGQTVFPYTFEIVSKDDITVVQNDTILAEGTNYSLTGVGSDTGGNITLAVGATAGDIITTYRSMALERTTDYQNSGDFLAAEVNDDFDRLWLALQQGQEVGSRAIVKPVVDAASINMTLPEASLRLNSYLGFDSTGAVTVTAAGDPSSPDTIVRQQFTGDGVKTVFTLFFDTGNFSTAMQLYVDGVHQTVNTYTTSGTTLTFTEAPPVDSDIEAVFVKVTNIGETTARLVSFDPTGTGVTATNVQDAIDQLSYVGLTRQQFTGDGTTTVFTLAEDAGASSDALNVYIDGFYQEASTFSVLGTVLTFTEAPPLNSAIETVLYLTGQLGTTTSNLVTYVPSGTGAVATSVQAKLRETVSVKDFGAVGDGVTDDTAAIQAAVDASQSVYIPTGVYNISSTIIVPAEVTITGENARTAKIRPVSGGVFISGFMMFFNTIDGVTWVEPYPNVGVGGMRSVYLFNDALSSMRGLAAAGSYQFSDLKSLRMDNTITMTGDYNDKVTISRVYATEATAVDYQIIVGQLGDGLLVEDVHTPWANGGWDSPTAILPKSIKVVGCSGGRLDNNLTGDIEVYRCSNVSISNTHTEGGTLRIDSSTVKVDGYFCTPNIRGEANIILSATDDGKYAVQLNGYHNGVWDNRIPDPYYEFDLKTHSDYQVSTYDCYKRWYRAGNIAVSDITGMQVENEAGSALTDFNNSSFNLSVSSSIRKNQTVLKDQNIDCGSGAFYSMGSSSAYAPVAWTGATATYHYRMQYIYDVEKLIGQTDGDVNKSFSLTTGGSSVLFPLGFSSRSPNAICRIYRGTSSNSYGEYVDVPMVSTRYLYDDGKQVSGVLWKSRTVGNVDSVNTAVKNITYSQDKVALISTSAPTVGTYAVGDVVYNSAPAAGGTMGWVCVTAGTPGTWKTFGAISA